MDLASEQKHLAQAERGIARGEEQVAAQVLLIKRLRRDKYETGSAEKLLLTFQQTLITWKDHRDAILDEIARLQRKRSP